MELRLTPQQIEVDFTDDGNQAVVNLDSVRFPLIWRSVAAALRLPRRFLTS